MSELKVVEMTREEITVEIGTIQYKAQRSDFATIFKFPFWSAQLPRDAQEWAGLI